MHIWINSVPEYAAELRNAYVPESLPIFVDEALFVAIESLLPCVQRHLVVYDIVRNVMSGQNWLEYQSARFFVTTRQCDGALYIDYDYGTIGQS